MPGPDYVFHTDRNAAGRYYVRSRIGNIVGVDTTLKTLVDAFKGNGVWLQFDEGVFDFGTITVSGDVTSFVTLTDVTIAGVGEDATTLQNTSDAALDTEVINALQTDGMTVRDLTVTAGGTARSTSDALDFDNADFVTIERVTVDAARGSALALDGKEVGATSRGHTIRDVTVTSANYEGVLCWAVEDSLFDNLHVSGAGITTNGQGIKFNRHSGGLCHNNLVRGGLFEGNGLQGVAIYAGTGNVVDAAVCRDNTGDGVRLATFSDGFAGLDNVLLAVRTINNGGFGISIVEDAAATMTATRIGSHVASGNTSGALNDGGTGTVIYG